MFLEDSDGRQVHIRLGVIVRQVHCILVLPKGGSLLHLQAVAAHVLRSQLQNMLQGLLPGRETLAGQAVHQIQGQVVEAHLPGQLHRLDRLPVAVGAAQLLEKAVVIALDPQGNPVEALRPQTLQKLFRDRIRIGLKGDFPVARHRKPASNGVQNLNQAIGAQKGGRTATEVHRVHLVTWGQSPGLLDVQAHRLQVVLNKSLLPGAAQGVEVAVLTLAAAEGYVDINAQGNLFLLCKYRHRLSPF